MRDFILPKDFLLGAATSATQIEGGEKGHSWYRWSQLGKIKDGSSSIRASDHWNRIDEDLELIKRLGLHTYRMGIEWSRIEPRPGEYDKAALAVYRREIEGLVRAGVRPLVTLYHFNNPLWFEDSNGWMRGDSDDVFLAYVRFVVEGLGDLVADWVTINEPNVYLVQSYILGEWPPGHSSIAEFMRGSRHLIRAHRVAYTLIHDIREQRGWKVELTRVGVAHHIRIFQSKHWWNPLTWLIAAINDFNMHGRFTGPMTRHKKERYADFFGINYYSRDLFALAPSPETIFVKPTVKSGAAVTDLGWEIYPKGLARILKRYRRYKLPIWITENGIADAEDKLRADYVVDHLKVVADAVAAGIPVERYYYWTLTDNFEWVEGEAARFGLYKVDFETQKRTLRPSGELYARICRDRFYRETS